jgi:3-hydroxyisobutyrate dehydrogenase-like beta-hydroxyacid dehydrogenase
MSSAHAQEGEVLMKCAVIGLGEVGSRYAEALREAGHAVVGYDAVAVPTGPNIPVTTTLGDAVAGADVVLVMTSAASAPLVAADALPYLSVDTLYMDFTSASPGVMREIGTRVEGVGAEFVDVAILGPVSVHGASVPVMLAGSGAAPAAEMLAAFGGSVEVLPAARPGDAMAHKLLRSIFMKGLASAICEAVEAANAAGLVDWTREQLANQLAGDGQQVIDRFLTGSRVHAVRRAREMRDTADYLTELGVPHTMSTASANYLEDLGRRVAANA